MIDLRNSSLPDAIVVDGREFLVKTDFREWLKLYGILKDCQESNKVPTYGDLIFLFKDKYPLCDFSSQIFEFFYNPNDTPNGGGSSENIVDFIQDGEYIVGSFMQAYGIDLTTCKMHWHTFQALFRSLPGNTKIVEIMRARGYKKDNRKQETVLEERKNVWKRPSIVQNKEEIIKGLQELFYDS